MSKKIAVYGTYEARVPVFQRYWKRRVDGVLQRYWKKTTRTKKVEMSGRYEFHGKGKMLFKAVKIALRVLPKGFIDVSADEFLRRPYEYGLTVNGLTKKSNLHKEWNLHFVLGYTDEETVMLDFDNTSFKTVRYWAARALKWFKLEGYIILKSSLNNYHVIFNRKVSWKENMHIVGWAALLSNNPMLQKWLLMQCIKEASTLRVSPKRDKASPRIVFRYGKENGQIDSFLKYRELVKNIIRKLKAD